MLRVLGIDPGSRNLGWGIVEMHGSRALHIGSGTLQARQPAFVPRMCQLITGLEAVVAQYAPCAAAVETVFTAKNMHSALVLGQARGAILVTLARAGLGIHEYTPMQIKQAATGRGRADKMQVQQMVRLLLGLGAQPIELDTSDALAAALCHAQAGQWAASATASPRRPSATPSVS